MNRLPTARVARRSIAGTRFTTSNRVTQINAAGLRAVTMALAAALPVSAPPIRALARQEGEPARRGR